MDFESLDDAALMTAISNGQQDALSALYKRYGRLVYSIAYRVLSSHATAEEVTLDIFNKVWQKANSYQNSRGNVRVWVSAMARNRAIDIIRQEKIRLDKTAMSWTDLTITPVSAEMSPEASTDLELKKVRVREALAKLPDDQRSLLALAYFGGFSQSEIAKKQNLPLGTVKTRIRAGMKKLRNLLIEEQVNF